MRHYATAFALAGQASGPLSPQRSARGLMEPLHSRRSPGLGLRSMLPIPDASGLGPTVDPDAVAKYTGGERLPDE